MALSERGLRGALESLTIGSAAPTLLDVTATELPADGLRGLADRVDALGGRLEVDSPPGAGTRVSARLPLRRAA